MPRLKVEKQYKDMNKVVEEAIIHRRKMELVKKSKRVKRCNKNSRKHKMRIIKAVKANLAFRVLYAKLGSFCPDMICDPNVVLRTDDALVNVMKLLLQSQPFDKKTSYFFYGYHAIEHLKALGIYEYHEECEGFYSMDTVYIHIKISYGFTDVFLTVVYEDGAYKPRIMNYGFTDEF